MSRRTYDHMLRFLKGPLCVNCIIVMIFSREAYLSDGSLADGSLLPEREGAWTFRSSGILK